MHVYKRQTLYQPFSMAYKTDDDVSWRDYCPSCYKQPGNPSDADRCDSAHCSATRCYGKTWHLRRRVQQSAVDKTKHNHKSLNCILITFFIIMMNSYNISKYSITRCYGKTWRLRRRVRHIVVDRTVYSQNGRYKVLLCKKSYILLMFISLIIIII